MATCFCTSGMLFWISDLSGNSDVERAAAAAAGSSWFSSSDSGGGDSGGRSGN